MRRSLPIRDARPRGVSRSVPFVAGRGDGSFRRTSSWTSSLAPTEAVPSTLRALLAATVTPTPWLTGAAEQAGPLAVESVVRHGMSFPSNSIRTAAFARQVAKEGEHVPCRLLGWRVHRPNDGHSAKRHFGDPVRRGPRIEYSSVKRHNRARIHGSASRAASFRSRSAFARPRFTSGKSARGRLTFVENGRAFRHSRRTRRVLRGSRGLPGVAFESPVTWAAVSPTTRILDTPRAASRASSR